MQGVLAFPREILSDFFALRPGQAQRREFAAEAREMKEVQLRRVVQREPLPVRAEANGAGRGSRRELKSGERRERPRIEDRAATWLHQTREETPVAREIHAAGPADPLAAREGVHDFPRACIADFALVKVKARE